MRTFPNLDKKIQDILKQGTQPLSSVSSSEVLSIKDIRRALGRIKNEKNQ